MKRLLLILLFLMLAVVLLAQPALDTQPSRQAQVQSVLNASLIHGVAPTGSMKPTFDERFFLLTIPKSAHPFHLLKPDDVILAWMMWDDSLVLVCHRIWRMSSGGSIALTKGDANQQIDPVYVTEAQYAGLVVGWVRRDIAVKPVEPVRFVLDGGATK